MKFDIKDELGQEWCVVYDRAVRSHAHGDGSLFFPQRLNEDVLKAKRKAQGPYIYANQYLNEIIPDGDQDFKKEWLKYFDVLPKRKTTFAFIDPAISLEDDACYTAFVVVDVDVNNNYYLRVAKRVRITATGTVKLVFDLQRIFQCNVIGIETVAYQKALMHFLDEEMRRRKFFVPVKGINRGPEQSKETRIRSLVPRFEWGKLLVAPGLTDFEDEYSKFPRGSFVDILDALASVEEIAFPPGEERKESNVPSPNSKDYEKWFIKQLEKGR